MAAKRLRTIYPEKWKTDPKYKGTISSGVSKMIDHLINTGQLATFSTSVSPYKDFGSGATGTFTNPENPEGPDLVGISVRSGSPQGGNPGALHEVVHLAQHNFGKSQFAKAAKKYGDYVTTPKYERAGLQEKVVRRQIPKGHRWSGLTREGEPLETDYSHASAEVPAYYYVDTQLKERGLRGKHLKSYLKQSGLNIPEEVINNAVNDMLAVKPRERTFQGGSAVRFLAEDVAKYKEHKYGR